VSKSHQKLSSKHHTNLGDSIVAFSIDSSNIFTMRKLFVVAILLCLISLDFVRSDENPLATLDELKKMPVSPS
jgi:hypothetical protein